MLQEILPIYQRDNVKALFLIADGTYVRPGAEEEVRHRSQAELLALRPAGGLSDLLASLDTALSVMPGQIASNGEA